MFKIKDHRGAIKDKTDRLFLGVIIKNIARNIIKREPGMKLNNGTTINVISEMWVNSEKRFIV